MQTLDHIAYNILNMIRAGRPEHNIHIDLRQIEEWIHQYRAMYIRRDLSRNRRYREFEQEITTGLSVVQPLDAENNQPKIVKTSVTLPPLLRLKDYEAITYVGSSDGLTSYQIADNHSVNWRAYSKYTPDEEIAYVLSDHHVYVKNINNAVEEITVRGIYANPKEFQELLIDEGKATEEEEWYYPLPKDVIESITKNILQTEVNMELSAPLDTQADTLPDEQTSQQGITQ